jgi:two-component system chemotaxis response regulator CheB
MEKNGLGSKCEAVIIGGSAGSIEILLKIAPALRHGLPFPIFIVLHRKYSVDSSLRDLIAHKTVVPVREIEDKDPIFPGTIYIAPADYHLLIEKDREFSLDSSEKVNFSRPSLDVAFESASEIYGAGLVGILLSGANADGTEGFRIIKEAGGITIAQSPDSCPVPYMPQFAIDHTDVDYILPVMGIADYINTTSQISIL